MQNSDIFHAPAMEKEVSLDDLAVHYPIIEEPEPIEESESTVPVVHHAPLEPNGVDPEAVVEAKSGEPEENELTPSTLADDTEPKSVHFAEDVAHVPAELDEQPHEPPSEEPISALNPVDESAEPDSITVPEPGVELSTHEVPSEDAPVEEPSGPTIKETPESEPIVHAQDIPEAPMEEEEQQPHESSEDTISPPTLGEISQPHEMEEEIPHSAPAEFDEPDEPSEEQQQDVAVGVGVSEPTIERFEEEKEASEEHHIDTGDIQNREPEPEPEVVSDSEVTAPGEDTEEAAPPTVVLEPVVDDVAPVESREIDEVPGDVEHTEEETQSIKAVEPEVDDVPPVESHEVEETPAETEQADVDPTDQDAPELKAEPATTPEAPHLEEAKEGHSLGYLAAAGAIIAGGAAVENVHAEEASAPVSSESREVDEPLKEEPGTVEEHVHNEEVHGLEHGITPGEPAAEQVPVQETEPPTKDVEIDQIPGIIQPVSVS
jgi:hypothetical protein